MSYTAGNHTHSFAGNTYTNLVISTANTSPYIYPSVTVPFVQYDPNASFDPEAWLRHRIAEVCRLAAA